MSPVPPERLSELVDGEVLQGLGRALTGLGSQPATLIEPARVPAGRDPYAVRVGGWDACCRRLPARVVLFAGMGLADESQHAASCGWPEMLPFGHAYRAVSVAERPVAFVVHHRGDGGDGAGASLATIVETVAGQAWAAEVVRREEGLLERLVRILFQDGGAVQFEEMWQPVGEALAEIVSFAGLDCGLAWGRDLDSRRLGLQASTLRGGMDHGAASERGGKLDDSALGRDEVAVLPRGHAGRQDLAEAAAPEALAGAPAWAVRVVDGAAYWPVVFTFAGREEAVSRGLLARACQLIAFRLGLGVQAHRMWRLVARTTHVFKGAMQQVLSGAEATDRFLERHEIHRGRAGDFCGHIQQGVEELNRRLADLSRVVRRGGGSGPRRSVSVVECLRRCAERFRTDAHAWGIGIDFPAEPGRVAQVRANEQELEIALSNLLDNAVKYSFANRDVWLAARQDDGFVEVSISNYGQGVLEDERERVFELFYRSPALDPAREIPGDGIGLFVARAIIEGHGGRIAVNSYRPPDLETTAAERGIHFSTTFRVLLPVEAR